MLRKFWTDISYAGVNTEDGSFGSKQQMIFNQLNFLAIATCIVRIGFMSITMARPFSLLSFIVCLIPITICCAIGVLTGTGRYHYAKFLAFSLLPPAIGLIAFQQNDYGLSTFPLLFCILAFFFLDERKNIFAAFINGAAWFITLRFTELLHKDSAEFFAGLPLLIFNHLLILSLIYLLLNFIKQVVNAYQQKLAMRSRELAGTNAGLLAYQEEILNKTGQLEARQKMLEDANRQKNKMLSVISHDLRTPILSVRNLLDLHEKHVMNDEELLNYIPELNREMSNVTDLLENLLAWSRQQQENKEVKKERIQLTPLVQEICGLYQFYAKGKSVRLVADVPVHMHVFADRQMIKTVLRNMVSNAIKFSNAGGRVFINAIGTHSEAQLSVTDEGRGITPENIARIINGEELTTKGTGGEFGSGLGLGLCTEFIQKNKGELYITSTPGVGSSFSFTLPVKNVPEPVPQNEVLKPAVALRPQAVKED